MFRQRFSVPLLKKEVGGYDAARPPPLLGLRQGAVFVAKPLHDPSGEFAIVLFDPTVDDKPAAIEAPPADKDSDAPQPEKVDEPIMHKSLADILGLKKKVEERPRVPVVIDPRLAKVLRPHQVEGVKVRWLSPSPRHASSSFWFSSCIAPPPASSTLMLRAASWRMRWASARRYSASLSCGPYSNNRLMQANQPSRRLSSRVRQVWSGIGPTSLVGRTFFYRQHDLT